MFIKNCNEEAKQLQTNLEEIKTWPEKHVQFIKSRRSTVSEERDRALRNSRANTFGYV